VKRAVLDLGDRPLMLQLRAQARAALLELRSRLLAVEVRELVDRLIERAGRDPSLVDMLRRICDA